MEPITPRSPAAVADQHLTEQAVLLVRFSELTLVQLAGLAGTSPGHLAVLLRSAAPQTDADRDVLARLVARLTLSPARARLRAYARSDDAQTDMPPTSVEPQPAGRVLVTSIGIRSPGRGRWPTFN